MDPSAPGRDGDDVRKAGILLVLFFGACHAGSGPTAPPGATPIPVKVQVLAPAPLERTLEATGTVVAIDSAELRPEMQGLVEAVLFEDGQPVKKGQALVRLRSADARAALADANARAKLASLNLERVRALRQREDASQADLDQAEANAALAKAAVDKAAEALRRTTISAPFDGVTGLREVAVGELIDPSRSVTRLESRDRLAVDLALPERALGAVLLGQKAEIRADALPDLPASGQVSYVAPRVDEGTRTLGVRVTVDQPGELLRPGLTAVARIVTSSSADALLVPTESVARSGGGMAVYVVGEDNKSALRPIEAGERTPDRLEVKSGLSAGDRVVVQGLSRMRPGADVVVQEPAPAGSP